MYQSTTSTILLLPQANLLEKYCTWYQTKDLESGLDAITAADGPRARARRAPATRDATSL